MQPKPVFQGGEDYCRNVCLYGMQSNWYVAWTDSVTLKCVLNFSLGQGSGGGVCRRTGDRNQRWKTKLNQEAVDLVTHRVAEPRHNPPLLEIGLSIQVGRLCVTHTIGVWCVKEKEVCRDDLIVDHLHEISYPHILPTSLHKLFLFPEIRANI